MTASRPSACSPSSSLPGAIKSVDDLADDDYRRRTSPRFMCENFERNLDRVPAHGDDIVPIPGTRRRL